MLTKIMRRGFIPVLLLVLLALLSPSSAGYLILLVGSAVCVGVMLGFQAGRAGKHFGEAGHAAVPCKVKYEN